MAGEGQVVVLDEGKMIEHIVDLPEQMEKAWTAVWVKDLTIRRENIENVVLSGMGADADANQLSAELFQDSATLPVQIWSDYNLPAYANDKTLVVAVSYSGDTEETVDAVKTALEKKCQAVVISSGGKIKELAQIHALPYVVVDYQAAPRAALGYLYGSVLVVLAKLGLINLTEKQYFLALDELKKAIHRKVFPAKAETLAITLNNKVPVVIGHIPLAAVAKRWVSQFNENAKTTAISAKIPELCHNFIAGLTNPILEKMVVLSLESNFGFSRNNARRKLLEKLMVQNDVSVVPLSVKAASPLAEQLLLLHFSDLLSYSLAGVYGVDPTPVDIIDELKAALKKL